MAKKRTKKSAASTRKKVVRKKASKSGGTRSQVKKSASANKTTSKKAATKRNASARKTVKKAVPRNRKPSRESEIKQLDRNILRLINKRAVATTKRLEARKQAKAPLFEPQVEDALWAELGEANRGPLPNHAVRGVFREILRDRKSVV